MPLRLTRVRLVTGISMETILMDGEPVSSGEL